MRLAEVNFVGSDLNNGSLAGFWSELNAVGDLDGWLTDNSLDRFGFFGSVPHHKFRVFDPVTELATLVASASVRVDPVN